MKLKKLTSKSGRIIAALAIVLIVGGYLVVNETQIVAQVTNGDTTQSTENAAEPTTVAIQSASAVMSEVSAAGHIELVSEVYVMQDVEAEVAEIAVNVGDQVGIDGSLQPAVYDTFAESFGFVERCEKTLRDAGHKVSGMGRVNQ